ncbi:MULTISPECIES: TonB-dependent hemoglobin/transferrin/lactoferrin family receptor [Rhizobium]|jgi:hemoglobin/transferrin/lactoferrin receptor protein|uniref:TonB-dependent hemoglobin/transferrin/lactoferrin family receptor n=1 Tax=Rhizobium TaxID=379 RepID=UPI000DD8D2FB|nr:TonB-dependent hemoglobin/transferrin/lactoferrin family receptor [Rhizobium lusitanum]NTJ07805.1 TonB-dependent hemoglobin/transferrin/lactoferrin family receptor [Rhizobium lusitanum]
MVVRRSRSVLLACTAFLALGLATTSYAQTATQTDEATGEAAKSDRVTNLKPIVVKGKAAKDVLADSPTATETTAKQIDDNQITRIEDLGRSTEVGVGFNRATGGVNIRGLGDDRVLTTVDGIEIPYMLDVARGADGGVNSFDFNSLSSVDIVRGADSSRAGSGALGGAFVLRTLEPEDLIAPGSTWGGVFKFGYNGDDRSIGGSAAVAKRIDNTAVLFEGGYTHGHELENNGDVGGYSTKRTKADPADYNQRSGLFKIRQYTDIGTFGITAEHYNKDKTIDAMHSQSLTGNFRPGNYDTTDNTERNRVSLDYKYDAESADSLLDTANAVFYWQNLLREEGAEGYRYTSVIGDYWRRNEMEDRSIGFNGNASKSFDTGSLHHKVTFGLDVAFSKVHQYSAGQDSCALPRWRATCAFLHTNQSDMPDVDGKRVGAFIDDKIDLGSSNVSLTPGLRFDWYDYSPKNTDAYRDSANYSGLSSGQSDSRFSPKLRASYQPQDNVELYAQWAMAFRAPNVSELYVNYGVPGGYVSYGNPDLKPETSNGIEIGTNLGDDDFGGHIGGFYNKYKNFIDSETSADPTRTYPLGITEYFNRANVRMFGVEVNAHKKFDNGIHIKGSLAYVNGKDSDSGEWIDSVAPAKAAFTVGYATEVWGTDFTFVTATSEPKKDGDNFRTPGYGIFDLTGWWEPEQVKGLSLRAGVYNIFNKTYYDSLNVASTGLTQPSAYYSEPGRTFKLTLTQRF